MNLRIILKLIFYLALLVIALLTVYISIFHESLFIFNPKSYIIGLGVLFAFVFRIFKSFFVERPDKTFYENYTKEQTVSISKSEFEYIIFQSFFKSGILFFAFCMINLLLAVFFILFQNYISIGNIVFSAPLIWPVYGKFQIRQEIQNSIYYNSSVNQTIKEDSIEIRSDNLYHEINYHNLEYFNKTDKWTILKRKKFDDYILIHNNLLVSTESLP